MTRAARPGWMPAPKGERRPIVGWSEDRASAIFGAAVKALGGRHSYIENVIEVGTPDTHVTVGGMSLWVELKAPKEPVRTTTALFVSNHKLTPQQRRWLERETRAGGVAVVLIATDHGRWLAVDSSKIGELDTDPFAVIAARAFWRCDAVRPKPKEWAEFFAAARLLYKANS